MKVLVYGLSACIGGVETFVFNYCHAIAKAFPQISFEYIVYDAIPGYVAERDLDPARFHVIPDRSTSLVANRRELKRLLAEGDFDCVWGNLCSLSDIGPLSCAIGEAPMRIVHAHTSQNMGTALTGILHKLHQKRVDSIATDFLACSQSASSFMFAQKDDQEDQVRIVPNGIDVTRFAFDEDARQRIRKKLDWESSLVMIYVGRLSPEKNPLFTLDVLRALRAKGLDARLLMLGDGSQREEIGSAIRTKGLDSLVKMLGTVPDVERYLSASDVLLMSSHFEGLPLALVEAQASGIFCVVSDGVSSEAVLSDHVLRVPLAKSAEGWAQIVADELPLAQDRSRGAEAVKRVGFDLKQNAQELGTWLLRRCDEIVADRGASEK